MKAECQPRDESLPHARNPDDEFWQGVLRTTREMESWPDWKLRQAVEQFGSDPASRAALLAARRGVLVTARFTADFERDTHRVFIVAGASPAHDLVREIVNAIARNTGRNDRHACLHVAFTVRDLGAGLRAAEAAARRVRDLYRGPYTRVFATYDTVPQ